MFLDIKNYLIISLLHGNFKKTLEDKKQDNTNLYMELISTYCIIIPLLSNTLTE